MRPGSFLVNKVIAKVGPLVRESPFYADLPRGQLADFERLIQLGTAVSAFHLYIRHQASVTVGVRSTGSSFGSILTKLNHIEEGRARFLSFPFVKVVYAAALLHGVLATFLHRRMIIHGFPVNSNRIAFLWKTGKYVYLIALIIFLRGKASSLVTKLIEGVKRRISGARADLHVDNPLTRDDIASWSEVVDGRVDYVPNQDKTVRTFIGLANSNGIVAHSFPVLKRAEFIQPEEGNMRPGFTIKPSFPIVTPMGHRDPWTTERKELVYFHSGFRAPFYAPLAGKANPAATAACLGRYWKAPPKPWEDQATAWRILRKVINGKFVNVLKTYNVAEVNLQDHPVFYAVAQCDPETSAWNVAFNRPTWTAWVESKLDRQKAGLYRKVLEVFDGLGWDLQACVNEVLHRQNSQIHAKHDEFLPFSKDKPRVIVDTGANVTTMFGPYINEATTKLKLYWQTLKVLEEHLPAGRVATLVGRRGERFIPVWGSGRNAHQLADFVRSMEDLDVWDFMVMAAGDDSLAVLKTPDGFVVVETDFSMYDQSQGVGPLMNALNVMRWLGTPPFITDAIYKTYKSPISVELESQRYIIEFKSPILPTGSPMTTLNNTINTITAYAYWYHTNLNKLKVEGSPKDTVVRTLELSMNMLGFKTKIKVHDNVTTASFLKGFFFTARVQRPLSPVTIEWCWAKLPGVYLKFGVSKTPLKDIPQYAKMTPDDASQRYLFDVAYGFANDYPAPISRALIKRWVVNGLGVSQTRLVTWRDPYDPLAPLNPFMWDWVAYEPDYSGLLERYNEYAGVASAITLSDLEELEGLIAGSQIGSMIEHPLVDLILTVDYDAESYVMY